MVINSIKKQIPDLHIKVEKIVTKGDKDSRPFYVINQNGVFEKEVNEKLLQYDADFAVHSLKDLHGGISEELTVACIPKRESPNDVFINTLNTNKLNSLEQSSIIGTSSIRRAIQIKTIYPDLKIRSIRGNIETRINVAKKNKYAGIILAEAGVKRLGLTSLITQILNVQRFIPSPGQGALAIVCRKDNTDLLKILKKIEHKPSAIEIQTERSLIEYIGAGCTIPMGALASLNKNTNSITLFAEIFSMDGKRSIKIKEQGNGKYPTKLGKKAAEKLIQKGAHEISKEWNNNMNNEMLKSLIE